MSAKRKSPRSVAAEQRAGENITYKYYIRKEKEKQEMRDFVKEGIKALAVVIGLIVAIVLMTIVGVKVC